MEELNNPVLPRQQAARLIEDVLQERLEPRLALLRWPETGLFHDVSLEAAYQALWHFEADEDKQRTELFYMDAQLELLRQMAVFLKCGRDLPAYFLSWYPDTHRVRFFEELNPVEDQARLLKRLWIRFRQVWKSAWCSRTA